MSAPVQPASKRSDSAITTPIRLSDRGARVRSYQRHLNDRLRRHGEPEIVVDGRCGPQTTECSALAAWFLGALDSTVETVRGGTITVGVQRIVADPATRTKAQRARARDRRDKSFLPPLAGSPKKIIDEIAVPLARMQGIDVTAASVEEANRRHGPTAGGLPSDHQGPPDRAWAADMSNGTHPTPQMDALAAALAEHFGIAFDGAGLVSRNVGGFRLQLIYRINTPQAGNHFNHVHFGARRL